MKDARYDQFRVRRGIKCESCADELDHFELLSGIHSQRITYLDSFLLIVMYYCGSINKCLQYAQPVGLNHLLRHLIRQLLACFPELLDVQPSQGLLHDEVRDGVYGETRELVLEIRCPKDGEDGRRSAPDERFE